MPRELENPEFFSKKKTMQFFFRLRHENPWFQGFWKKISSDWQIMFHLKVLSVHSILTSGSGKNKTWKSRRLKIRSLLFTSSWVFSFPGSFGWDTFFLGSFFSTCCLWSFYVFQPLLPLPSQLPFFCQAAIGHLEVTHQPQGRDHGQSHNAHGHKSHSSTAMNRVALAQHDLRVNDPKSMAGWWLGPFGRCFFGGRGGLEDVLLPIAAKRS